MRAAELHHFNTRPAMPAAAAVLAQAGAENFPVASRLLPRREREHLLAVYGFARLVDDVGDEAQGDRLALLDWLEADLERVYDGEPEHPLMRRLAATVRELSIPAGPFRRLIEANRQDQRVGSYRTIDELMAYCELSANPVGEIVLHVFGAADDERVRLSDAVCSGLQLTEHWQDVAEDLARGRVYLPEEDMERFGVTRDDLASGRATPAFRELMELEVARARALLSQGAPLIRTLRGRPALAVAAFVAGGRSALGAIERAGYDVLSGTPRPSRARRLASLLTTLVRGG
ncbi:MAG: squalene synthase HpnC [Thermoleophilaceae bacterium]|nr:squalene synthase HpnC [Thermoleophilaceae bacterium]